MNKKKRQQKRLAKKMRNHPKGLLSYLDTTYKTADEYFVQVDSQFVELQKQVNNLSKEIGQMKKGDRA